MKKQKINHLNLWKKYQTSRTEERKIQFRNRLAEIYYPLVQKIAYKLSEKINSKLSPEELTSFGVDGLFIAISKFDIYKGVKFEQYASSRIHGSMIDNIRKIDPIPRSVRINNSTFEEIRFSLENEKGRYVTDDEVVEKMGLSVSEYNQKLNRYHPVMFSSLEGSDMSSNNDNEFKNDFNPHLKSKNTPTPYNKIIRKEFFNKLLGDGFTPAERMIVYLYYYKSYTMDKISEKLKMSESRVSQIHKSLIFRMRDKVERNPKYFSEYIENMTEEAKNLEILF